MSPWLFKRVWKRLCHCRCRCWRILVVVYDNNNMRITYDRYNTTNIVKVYGIVNNLIQIGSENRPRHYYWRIIQRFNKRFENGRIWNLKLYFVWIEISNFLSRLFGQLSKSSSAIKLLFVRVISMRHCLTTYNHVYGVWDNKRPRRNRALWVLVGDLIGRIDKSALLFSIIGRGDGFISYRRRPGNSDEETDNFYIPLSFRRRSPSRVIIDKLGSEPRK